MHLLQEGGPIFMYPLLIILFIVLGLIIKGFIVKDSSEKVITLLQSVTLFALVFGLLGQILGLIQAFDFIQSIGNISTEVLSAGLKVSFLPAAFGFFIFLVGRFGIILHILKK